MRILMINHEFTRSGASKIFLRLASHLKAAGHDITLFPLNPQHGPVREEYVARGIPIREQIANVVFDLAIANTICAAPIVLRIGGQIRTIWWVHEAEVAIRLILQNPEWAGAFARAAVVLLESPSQRDDTFRPFLSGIDERKVFMIRNGIVPAADDPAADASVVPVGAGAVRVISVATIEPRKRHHDLVHAVARLTRVNIECVICGTFFTLEPEALKIVQGAPGRFRILSGLSDEEVRAWVKSADMFCLPSFSETQGIAVYEAALLSKPLVITDLPCYRGVFTHGRDALMYPAGDVDLLGAMLEGLATRPALRQRLGAAAKQSAAPWTDRRFLAEFETVLSFATAS